MSDLSRENPDYRGPAIFSYGFRPFFLGAALFAGVVVPIWILVLAGAGESTFLYPARDWHVHEMVFGFLPAVITGFLLTAITNWTDRSPIRVLVSLLAGANILFHAQILWEAETDRAERIAIAMVMMLMTLIGGRLI